MSYDFENVSVLVVDDMPPMLSLVASLLRIFGFKKVITASDAERAFELFCKESPDIVLTDWQMEPIDGVELARQIRTDHISTNPYVPIILMTGYSAEIRVMRARDNGITEFLVKPFTAQDLYSRLKQVIEHPRKFVAAEEFFGPDRRRKRIKSYEGPSRREGEDTQEDKISESAEEDLRNIVVELQEKGRSE